MTGIPAVIGVGAIILLGLVVSACAGGGSDNRTSDDCQPGVCVGSTPDSTPDSLAYLAR